jgi:hypothetical protein
MNEEELPSELRAAVGEFVHWYTQRLRAEQESTKITHTLYHYTNENGLRGIIESQRLWFTSYLHLNDPSELTHGMNVAHGLLKEISESTGDGLVKMFCDLVDNLFQHRNFAAVFGFYIASLSSAENDLGQWRAYADNGRGFALGLAPHLFEAIETPHPKPTEHIVMPVVYGNATDKRYRAAIEAAAGIVQSNRPHLRDKKIAIPFMREMATRLIAGQLIGISLGVKHEAYSHEREVRLIILGTQHSQKDDVRTRIRGSEIVPYMESSLPLRDKDGIFEIVLGPAAGPSAKDAVQRLLQSFGIDPNNRIRESGIPYRAL